jgi:biotin carboxyl carrier protein
MYKATINGKQFEITEADDKLFVNGESVDLNSTQVSDGYFHILLKNKSYRAEVVKVDYSTKAFTFKINGKIYPVVLKNKFDLLLEKMGMSGNATSKVNNIKAPMPGLIIDLRVKEGDQVNTGDTLIILEAMKMENSIKSPGQAQVKSVKVKKGESVEKGQTLIEFL